LPIRYSDFAVLYRDERPGELSGLTRLRAFSQDDGHIFAREDQIESEISNILDAIKDALTTYKLDNYWMRFSLRDPENKTKYLGSDEVWERSQAIMRKLLQEKKIEHKEAEGEAAFYGPKIDIMAVDALGREWQISTIQLDFNQPARFKLEYAAEDGTKKTPVMIHRALIGSPDRFLGVLIEHYAGAFPLWLCPVQVKVIPVRTNHTEYAKEVYEMLKANNIRAELDDSDSNLGGKVRDAKNMKMPYWLVIGDKEIEAGKVTLESRDAGQLGQISKEELIAKLSEEIKQKK
jgi:threonyl-tRNA synthetase